MKHKYALITPSPVPGATAIPIQWMRVYPPSLPVFPETWMSGNPLLCDTD